MKLKMSFVAGAAFIAMASAAQALPVSGQISVGGYATAIGSVGMAAAMGIDFVSGSTGGANPGTAGGITGFGQGTGSFANFACGDKGGSCGSIKDLLTFNAGAINGFLTLYNGATTVSFDLAALTISSRDFVSNTISLNATGTINETGYESTAGTFILSAQGDNITSFSATAGAVPTPEPFSLAIMGGALVVLGLVRRKTA